MQGLFNSEYTVESINYLIKVQVTIITNYLSYCFGLLANIDLPVWFRPIVYRVYSQICHVDLTTVPESLKSYPSLGKFFTRDLIPGSRQMSSDFVSPVDGFLRDQLTINGDQQIQVKGVGYRISTLIGKSFKSEEFYGGALHNLYLSPKDYHHVHAPCAGKITRLVYISGFLWPVNNFTFSRLPNLFARNERVIMELETERGKLLLIMVGALNVGKISLAFSDLITNQVFSQKKSGEIQEISVDFSFAIGERLGTFHLGSSVVLLADQSFLQSFSNDVKWAKNCPIQLGNSLYELPKKI